MVVATVSTPVFAEDERDYDDDSHERDYDDDSHEREEDLIEEIREHLFDESEQNENNENYFDTDSLNPVQEPETIQNVEMSVTAVMDGTNVIAINGKTTSDQEVSLLIRAPNENLIHVDQLTPDINGMFGTNVIIEGQQWSQDGLYTITTKQGNSSFNVIKLTVEVNAGKTIETIVAETNQNDNFRESLIVKSEENKQRSNDDNLQYDDELHDENYKVELEYEEEYGKQFEEEFEDSKISVESNSENFFDALKKLFTSWFGF